MTEDQAVRAVYGRWIAQWPGLSTNVPFVFDNDALDAQAPSYARVSVDLLQGEQQTLGQAGSRKFIRPGLVDVKLHGPGDAGRSYLDVLAGYVKTIYESVRFGAAGTEEGVITYTTTVTELRPQSTAQYWVLMCSTSFEFIEVR